MTKNMKHSLILLMIAGMFSMPCITYGQSKSGTDVLHRRIPVVTYTPWNFFAAIDEAFVHPNTEYIDITIQDGDTVYCNYWYSSSRILERPTFGFGPKTYDDDFFRRNDVNTDLFFSPDSVFLVSLMNTDRKYPYGYHLPLYRVYGVKRNGSFRFGLTKGNGELYTWGNLLSRRYGSVEKFQELYAEYMGLAVQSIGEEYNGVSVYPEDKKEMKDFLMEDYLIHENYCPADTTNVLNFFVKFVSAQTRLKERQGELLKEKLIEHIRWKGSIKTKKEEIRYYSSQCLLYGYEVSKVISRVLTDRQWDEFWRGHNDYNKKRSEYISTLHLFSFPKDLIPSYQEMLEETAKTLLNAAPPH